MKKYLTYLSSLALIAFLATACSSSSEMASMGGYDGIYAPAPSQSTEVTTSKPASTGYSAEDATEAEYQYYDPNESYDYKTAYEDEGTSTYSDENYDDEYYDYEYASRIRRFHTTTITNNYYSPWYTNSYWYNPAPWSFNYSIYDPYYYHNWRYRSGWSIGFHFGYSPWGYSPWAYSPWYNPYPYYGVWAYNPYYSPWYGYPVYTDDVYPSDVYYGSRNGTGYSGGNRGGVTGNRNSTGRNGMSDGPKTVESQTQRNSDGRRVGETGTGGTRISPRTSDNTRERVDGSIPERRSVGTQIEQRRESDSGVITPERRTTQGRQIQSPAERQNTYRTSPRNSYNGTRSYQRENTSPQPVYERSNDSNDGNRRSYDTPRRSNTYSTPTPERSAPTINRSSSPSRSTTISAPSRNSGSYGGSNSNSGSSRSTGGSRSSGGRR